MVEICAVVVVVVVVDRIIGRKRGEACAGQVMVTISIGLDGFRMVTMVLVVGREAIGDWWLSW